MNAPTEPSETEVLRAISDLLTAPRSSAALAHYPTLRIQTTNLRSALAAAMKETGEVVTRWSEKLREDVLVAPDFQAQTSPLYAYRLIAPLLVHNLHQTAGFLMDETIALPAVDMDRVGEIVPSFGAFVRLGSAVRQFLDALVQTAYQLIKFDGRQLNYKFLQSLYSFAPVAPVSLHSNIYSPEIQAALHAFAGLPPKDRKNSTFTSASYEQFPQRLLVVSQQVTLPDWRRSNLECVYSFCSDFVHSGYVSALAVDDRNVDMVLGGPGDAFTPRAENFAELRQRLLAECAGAYADLLIPALQQAMDRTLISGTMPSWRADMTTAAKRVDDIRSILQRHLVAPIRKGLIGSQATIDINCLCGGRMSWHPPHRAWECFCEKCGSRHSLLEVDEDVDYVISPTGPGNVLGSDAAKMDDLEPELRAKLDRIATLHAPEMQSEAMSFVLVFDLVNCAEDTLRVASRITSVPAPELKDKCGTFAFVADKSLQRSAIVRIECNCGASVDHATADRSNICRCARCGQHIGLIGVAGGGSHVKTRNPDGTPSQAPIQARRRFIESNKAVN